MAKTHLLQATLKSLQPLRRKKCRDPVSLGRRAKREAESVKPAEHPALAGGWGVGKVVGGAFRAHIFICPLENYPESIT